MMLFVETVSLTKFTYEYAALFSDVIRKKIQSIRQNTTKKNKTAHSHTFCTDVRRYNLADDSRR